MSEAALLLPLPKGRILLPQKAHVCS